MVQIDTRENLNASGMSSREIRTPARTGGAKGFADPYGQISSERLVRRTISRRLYRQVFQYLPNLIYLPYLIFILLTFLQARSIAADSEKLQLTDAKGAKITLFEGKSKKPAVFFFITNDCPIANSYAPEIERISKAYTTKGFQFYLVYVDPALTGSEALHHAKEYGYTLPALLDSKHKLVKRAQALVTPETAIFSPAGKLLYHGRIDDRAVEFGKVRVAPTVRDLRVTLDAIKAGKPIPHSTAKAVGCYIADLAIK